MNKLIYVLGGGTFSHVRNHLALSMPAFGTTAKKIYELCKQRFENMTPVLRLTRMADDSCNHELITNDDIDNLVKEIIQDLDVKIIFFNVALCDFDGMVNATRSGKYSERLDSSKPHSIQLFPVHKILKQIREKRKDIFLVAFKTTCGATEYEQYIAGLNLLKKNSCNLVLANDTKTRLNMIITPEEAKYHIVQDRDEVLKQLVDMTYLRSHLSFTHSTVVDGQPIPWNSELVYPSLRTVVDYCISQGAYKPFKWSYRRTFCVQNRRK